MLTYVAVPDALALDDADLMASYEIRHGQIQRMGTRKRVALVSVYGVTCGISTYAGWLWGEMSQLIEEGRVFAEREAGAPEIEGVTRCWTRGEALTELVAEIEAYDPDLIMIQHEYGIFPDARHWLSFMGALSARRVIVTLHSVYAAHRDKTIVEASCPEVVVHTDSARDVLRSKGITAPVHVIPHGSLPCEDPSKLWNLYRSQHTIMASGFGYGYKSWDVALEVVAALKPDYPDVFYTGLVSERTPGAAIRFVAELNELARKLDIVENVAFIRGFQSEAVLDSFYRTNRVCLLPYRLNGEHTVHGCSGAARLAMRSGIAVVASQAPLFDDLEGICPRPSTVEGYAEAVRELFEDDRTQIARQVEFLERTSWGASAERYLSV